MRWRTLAVAVLIVVGLLGGVYASDAAPADLRVPIGGSSATGSTPQPSAAGGSAADGSRTVDTPLEGPTTATDTPSATPTTSPTPTRTPMDPDRDNLPTRYEESLGTAPDRKTVLLAVAYTGNATPLSAGDRSFLRAKFAELKVTNPDGSTGVDLRIVTEWNRSAPVAVNSTTLRQRAVSYLRNETRAEPCRHHYLLVGAPQGKRWGIAATGGWSAIVKSATTGFSGSREDVIVHELLHNLVGELDPDRDGVRSDGAHTTSGWLQPKAEMGGPSSLHPASRRVLNDRGFANSYSRKPGCL